MNDREAFEAWANDYGLRSEPNYSKHTESDCLASWQAATQRQQERIAYVEKVADDAIELGNQQAIRIAELEAQVQALSLDAARYQFATAYNDEGRLNFKSIYDAWDGDGSFTDQIDTAIAAGKGEI